MNVDNSGEIRPDGEVEEEEEDGEAEGECDRVVAVEVQSITLHRNGAVLPNRLWKMSCTASLSIFASGESGKNDSSIRCMIRLKSSPVNL